jgi:hypothetical protein
MKKFLKAMRTNNDGRLRCTWAKDKSKELYVTNDKNSLQLTGN